MNNFRKSGGFGGDRGKPRFNKGGFGGRPSFGDRGDRGGRDGDRPKFKATCASCNKECEVPFRPSGERPVYCSNCFRDKGDSSPRNFGKRDEAPKPFGRRDNAPFAKPQSDNRIDALKSEINGISAKLDTLIKIVGELKSGTPKSAESGKVAKASTKKKATAKKK